MLPGCRSPFPSKILASVTPSSQHGNETLFMQIDSVAFLAVPARVTICFLNFGRATNSKHGSRKRSPPFPPAVGGGEPGEPACCSSLASAVEGK